MSIIRALVILISSLFFFVATPSLADAKPPKGHVSAEKKKKKRGGSSKSSNKKKRIKYRVKAGDTLGAIAKKYDVRVKDIVRWNKLKNPDKIREGQKLTIKTTKRSSSSSKSSSSSTSQQKMIYVVRKGDSLSKIAKKNGVTLKQLLKWNRRLRKNPDKLRVGQKINIYVKVTTVSSGKSASIGKANKGSLVGGIKLPKGAGYTRRNSKRQYGTELTISHIVNVMAKYDARYPDAPDFVAGDVSFKNGGYMKPHKSHQSGRDVDFGFIMKDGTQLKKFKKMNKKTFDVAKNWYVIKEFIDTGDVQYIFIDYKLQKLLYNYAKKKGVSDDYLEKAIQYPNGKRSYKAIVRHASGHADHMHIRFNCPKGDKQCK